LLWEIAINVRSHPDRLTYLARQALLRQLDRDYHRAAHRCAFSTKPAGVNLALPHLVGRLGSLLL
jgi:hypothetical protein